MSHCYLSNLSLSHIFLFLVLPDVVLFLCEREHVEGGMIFQLLEDLTEMSTMRNCRDIFGYIESKQDILGKVCDFKILPSFCLSFYLFSAPIKLFDASSSYSTMANNCIYVWCLLCLQQELFARGKLVMLRTCNQLLRRLSKVVWWIYVHTHNFLVCKLLPILEISTLCKTSLWWRIF